MKNQRGYSLMEMLVVVAIIGVLMLVTIPNFINMRKSTIVKGGLRQFTNDLRVARQRAVTASSRVKISYKTGQRFYYVYEHDGTKWNLYGSQNPRYLPESVYLEDGAGASKFTDTESDPGSSGLADIVFERNGVAVAPAGLGTVLLKSGYTDIPKPSYTISVRTTGMISTQ